jgi:hypothetical protein
MRRSFLRTERCLRSLPSSEQAKGHLALRTTVGGRSREHTGGRIDHDLVDVIAVSEGFDLRAASSGATPRASASRTSSSGFSPVAVPKKWWPKT